MAPATLDQHFCKLYICGTVDQLFTLAGLLGGGGGAGVCPSGLHVFCGPGEGFLVRFQNGAQTLDSISQETISRICLVYLLGFNLYCCIVISALLCIGFIVFIWRLNLNLSLLKPLSFLCIKS